MAKRLIMIPPFDVLTGNISGRQDLRYALNNNKAFESPAGSVNYARNYTPRYVGVKIAASGKSIFSVRTKNAVNMTPKAIKAMALLGGSGAIVGSLLAHKSGTPYQNMYVLWQYALTHGYEGYTFRKFAMEVIRPKLEAKVQNIQFQIASISVNFKNPWHDGSQTTGATVSQKVLVEFWMQLNTNPIDFYVNGKKGIAMRGEDFNDVIGGNYNVLNLQSSTIGSTDYVVCNSEYLLDGAAYVTTEDEVVASKKYTTTTVQPA